MDSILTHIKGEFVPIPHRCWHVLFVFISFLIVFGILSSHQPQAWNDYLPTLLMGLSYGIMSLSLDQLFREDWEDGTLERWMSEGKSLEVYISVKCLTHWVRLGIPMMVLVGLITGFKSLPLLIGIASTTLMLTLLGSIPSALCLSSKNNATLLLPLLTFPLGVPMMLISMASFNPTEMLLTPYLLQGGLLLITVALFYIACPFALRLLFR